VDVEKVLSEYAPEGVDYFFDNVGGEFSAKVMKQMKEHGKIALCGAISRYNNGSNSISNSKLGSTNTAYLIF
jgi:NADPH-dependent curcumin reductase CurA